MPCVPYYRRQHRRTNDYNYSLIELFLVLEYNTNNLTVELIKKPY